MIAMSPTFERRLDELSPASDRIWLAGLTVGLTLTLLAAFAPLPAGGGTMLAYLGLLIRGALYLRAGDALPDRGGAVLAGLLRMGIVAGAVRTHRGLVARAWRHQRPARLSGCP